MRSLTFEKFPQKSKWLPRQKLLQDTIEGPENKVRMSIDEKCHRKFTVHPIEWSYPLRSLDHIAGGK